MFFQQGRDLVDVDLRLGIAGLDVLDLVLTLAEETAEQPLLLIGILGALELCDQISQQIADLAEILGGNILQGVVREIGDLLLRRRAVLQDDIGFRDVDLLRELIDRLLFRVAQLLISVALLGGLELGFLHFTGIRIAMFRFEFLQSCLLLGTDLIRRQRQFDFGFFLSLCLGILVAVIFTHILRLSSCQFDRSSIAY
jgi:hypothetical protein